MLKHGFGVFFAAQDDALDCTAHSHHPWPDVAAAAHARYASDSMRLTNDKWDVVFGQEVPKAQAHVAREIGWPEARQIAFAPNTHEFVLRLYSCLQGPGPHRVVTSNHEFHSFGRQTRRYEEAGRIVVTRVADAPHADFGARFVAAVQRERPVLVWLSQVFFDSGFAVPDLEALVLAVRAAAPDALIVIDGYHAFCALPMNLRGIAPHAFYLAGGYKYAMSGEGVCWLAVPPGNTLRPENTGWFADFDDRARPQGGPVGYADDGMRFFGATFDASGIYRFNAVRDWLAREGVTTAAIHDHVLRLQDRFQDGLAGTGWPGIRIDTLTPPRGIARGHFLTFDTPDATALAARLAAGGIRIDQRGTRIRFGFGVYHDDAFIATLLARLGTVLGA